MVDLDQFRRHLGRHLQQLALFSLPRLIQGHDQSLGPHDDPGVQDRDASPEGYRWIKDDCESKWRIVSRKRGTIMALARFLFLDSSRNKAYGLRARSIYHGNKDLIQLLIDQGAHAVADNERFNEALQAAAYGGYEEMIRPLVKQCADVNAQGGEYGNALLAALEGGRDKIVQLLIDCGADTDALNEVYGIGNALHMAALGGHDKIVQLLTDYGADIEARNREGDTSLHVAVHGGHDKIVQLLIERGADVNVPSRANGNALHVAVDGGHDKIVRQLLESGADTEARDGEDNTPLQLALSRGHDQIVEQLLVYGADIEAQGGKLGTALYVASSRRHKKILQILLQSQDERKYKTPRLYTKVEVLLLCWEHTCNDLDTKDELDDLKATFENRFNYHTETKYMGTTSEQRLQVRVNTMVAAFVAEHDGPNTLFIVYYAGHSRLGGKYGSLELFGSVKNGSLSSDC